jgi:hypothetical protein
MMIMMTGSRPELLLLKPQIKRSECAQLHGTGVQVVLHCAELFVAEYINSFRIQLASGEEFVLSLYKYLYQLSIITRKQVKA